MHSYSDKMNKPFIVTKGGKEVEQPEPLEIDEGVEQKIRFI